MTTHRDQYFEVWGDLPKVPGSGPLTLAEAGYELARFLDGYGCVRADRVSATIFRLATDPSLLLDEPLDDPRLVNFVSLLKATTKQTGPILCNDIRSPWSDDDLRLFASRVLKVWEQAQASLHAELA